MASVPYDTYDYPKYWRGREYEDRAEKQAILSLLGKIPPERKNSLVDIGGGFGRLAPLYAPLFAECLLIDPSSRLLREAQKKVQKYPHLGLKRGKLEHLPVGSGAFDVALLVRVVHHLKNPQKAFLEVYRVLKPGGFLILEFANKAHFRACLRAWLEGDFGFSQNPTPANQASKGAKIPFLNHHPRRIEADLEKTGFEVLDCLSVSNFRLPFLK